MHLHRKPIRALAGLAAIVLAATLAGCAGGGAGDSDDWRTNEDLPVPVGFITDLTGPLNVYGVPKSNVTKLAIEAINADGGVLGRELDLIEYDSKSANEQNVQYANRLVQQDDAAVVFGGVLSSARDAMRPILSRAKTLYVFNTVYEGGMCDANMINTGQTASQKMKPLVDYAVENIGKTIYIVGADYGFGRISGQWVREFAEAQGATIVGDDYVALDSGDFSSTISNIQAEKPDVVFSLLVGANHLAFFREFAAKGLSASSTIVSPTFGDGNEQDVLTPEESEGIVVAATFYETLENDLTASFIESYDAAYGTDRPTITDLSMMEWNGWHLWKAAVEKAGSFDRDKVLAAFRTGEISIDGPTGKVTVDGPTQQAVLDITIATTENAKFVPLETFDQVVPSYEQEVCDIIANPNSNEQFTP